MSSIGKIEKVDMDLTSNLHAYPYENKYGPQGNPQTERMGDNSTGMNTGSAHVDQKVNGDFADGNKMLRSYRG